MTTRSPLAQSALDLADDGLILLAAAPGGGTPFERLILLIEPDRAHFRVRRYHGGDGTPMDEWHGRTIACAFPHAGALDAEALADWADEVEPLVARMQAGHAVEWDGSNMVGTLTDDARAAQDALAERIENADIGSDWTLWDTGEWLDSARHEIKADMDDAALAVWVADAQALARSERVILTGDVADWARKVRDEKLGA